VWSAISGLEQQTILAFEKGTQALCDFFTDVNFTVHRIRFEIFDDAGRVTVNLLMDADGTAVVDDVFFLKSECL